MQAESVGGGSGYGCAVGVGFGHGVGVDGDEEVSFGFVGNVGALLESEVLIFVSGEDNFQVLVVLAEQFRYF